MSLSIYGSSFLTLDAKGRLVIPAKYRDLLRQSCEGTLTITKDPQYPSLLIYPGKLWKEISSKCWDKDGNECECNENYWEGCGTDNKHPNVTRLSTFKDSTSYALGADLGTNLKQQKVEIDFDFFMAGILDGMETDVVLLDKNQRREMMVALQKFVREKANEAGRTNLKTAKEFLEKNIDENSDVK